MPHPVRSAVIPQLTVRTGKQHRNLSWGSVSVQDNAVAQLKRATFGQVRLSFLAESLCTPLHYPVCQVNGQALVPADGRSSRALKSSIPSPSPASIAALLAGPPFHLVNCIIASFRILYCIAAQPTPSSGPLPYLRSCSFSSLLYS
jgi:hypothetical protein